MWAHTLIYFEVGAVFSTLYGFWALNTRRPFTLLELILGVPLWPVGLMILLFRKPQGRR